MKRANLIPSVLFGAILASIIITSPEAENLKLPVSTLPQVVEFSGKASQQSRVQLQSVTPAAAEQNNFAPYSQSIDSYDDETQPSQTRHGVFSLQAG